MHLKISVTSLILPRTTIAKCKQNRRKEEKNRMKFYLCGQQSKSGRTLASKTVEVSLENFWAIWRESQRSEREKVGKKGERKCKCLFYRITDKSSTPNVAAKEVKCVEQALNSQFGIQPLKRLQNSKSRCINLVSEQFSCKEELFRWSTKPNANFPVAAKQKLKRRRSFSDLCNPNQPWCWLKKKSISLKSRGSSIMAENGKSFAEKEMRDHYNSWK